MERSGVVLGFTREPSGPWIDFPSKAGGAPVWLDPQSLPPMADACCGFCEEPLQFLLQVSLSEGNDESSSDRFSLLVFMCPKMACLSLDQAQQSQETSHRSVKVFRAQVPARRNDPSNGVQLCDWCHTWKGGSRCGGCRKISYCSRKHQVEHWQAGHSYWCKNSSSDKRADRKTLWHEFELEFSDEEEEEEEEDEEAADSDGLHIVPATDLEGFQEPSREDSFWAAFEARMMKAPSQVLRLGSRTRDSKPLWMKLQGQACDADIPSCKLCGAPRVFEFQVMSQLLYFFGVENEKDSLDWGTIAVYSCESLCPVEGYVQEFAWVQFSP